MAMQSQWWIKCEENVTVKAFKRTWLKIGCLDLHQSPDPIMEGPIEFSEGTKRAYTDLKILWTKTHFLENIDSTLPAENAAALYIIPYFTIFSTDWKYSHADQIVLTKKMILKNLTGKKLKLITWF